jgi:radical SAM protein with 4Fe4S-binding SPASM domain
MNFDGQARLLENLRLLKNEIERIGNGLPLIVPVFTKCAQNLHEMEACYDHWKRMSGHCVIAGPSDFAGQIASVAAADMTPPKRTGCRRINTRMTILSDGAIVSCEQDVCGVRVLGRVGQQTIKDIWQTQFAPLREAHACGKWNDQTLCRSCSEWHRP